jgi:hypothetical protein
LPFRSFVREERCCSIVQSFFKDLKCHKLQKLTFWIAKMISHFWNLCRACPALDVDKVKHLLKCQFR